ncbi:MAG: hypothetical protein HQM14_09175 [SAR324 cluster bacterium]|nr:hypothetical protein [SAR324 cluster bacterium]
MAKVLLVVVAIALIYWISNIRKKNVFKRHRLPERTLTAINGFEVQTFLSVETPLECLQYDGLRFGESFRLKMPPPLPHQDNCQCKVVDLSYTSTEVFDGALRENSFRDTAIGVLNYKEASILKEMLKNLHAEIPENFETYCEQLELDVLSKEKQEKIKELIQQKMDHLQMKESNRC